MNSLCPSCDKKRGSMNNTNWIRHKESCHKKSKTLKKAASSTISKYFSKIEVIEQPLLDYTFSDIEKRSEPNDQNYSNSYVNFGFSDTEKLCKPIDQDCSDSYVEVVQNNDEHIIDSNLHEVIDGVDKTLSIFNLKNIDLQNCLFPNDPIRIPSKLSHVLLNYFFEQGACQPSPFDLPSKMFPKTKDSTGKLRSFHECYYFTNIPTKPTPIKRQWLSYSPTVDQIFCTTCKLFSLKKGKNRNLVDHGSNNWKHLKRTIENHESSTEHLQAEISCGIYTKNQRLDLTLLHSANQQIASNRELLRVIIDALLYTARQNIALRGHNEKKSSLNRGNFLELLSVLSINHAGLKYHLDQINMSNTRQRVSFISNRSQNKLLNIMSESIRSQILKDVKDAGIFSVIIDTTTDIANYEQLTFVLRYVNNSGSIEERLVALETTADGTGQGLFKKCCSITEKYNLNWRQNLCAQSYDGAASMQDTCDCCEVTKHFFGEVQALVSFFRARKRTATFIESQQKLYPGDRTRRLKCFSDTRWTSHGRVITVLFERFGAILETLKRLVNDNDRVTSSGAKSL
ncbi:zinc finger MYM-type protein 1-like [Aphis gossypii]|uniref:zinc finger MYM-type protein 1-like n=1 Tax=Aphis gossypii TaxID=80765 RepID=UPI00215928AA|nr:zinc finger MYM-type protein 1-like [Aphis gossypii]